MTPRESVTAESRRRGRAALISGCVDILRHHHVETRLVRALGGPAAETVLAGYEGGPDGYWPRVWAARGLLHVWDDAATEAIIDATRDEAWRVREMACKVIARHLVGDALDAVVPLAADPVPRVRAAAGRAVQRLTAHQA